MARRHRHAGGSCLITVHEAHWKTLVSPSAWRLGSMRSSHISFAQTSQHGFDAGPLEIFAGGTMEPS